MASPKFLDMDPLLLAISEDRAAGEDLREDGSPNSVYYQIKDARSAGRAAERAAEVDGQDGSVGQEWRTIASLAPKILAERSKDVEIVAWLIEALVRLHGFAGLRDGYQLVARLAENFWEGLYPGLEDGTYEGRMAALVGLNGQGGDGTLVVPLRKVPLTACSGENYCLWQFQQASKSADSGGLTMDALQDAARGTPTPFFLDLLEDLTEAKASFQAAMAVLNERAGADAPPDSNIRNALDAAEAAVRFLAGPRLETAGAGAEEQAAGDPGAPAEAARPSVGKAVASREAAFQDLRRIADFFRATEPHSFISYALEEIVRRGQLSLQELIGELIPNQDARSLFLLSAGIKPPESW